MRKLLLLFVLLPALLPAQTVEFTAEELASFTIEDLGDQAEARARKFAEDSTPYWNNRNAATYTLQIKNWKANFWGNGSLIPLPIPAYKVECKVFPSPVGWLVQGYIADTCDIADPPEFVVPMYQPGPDELRRMTSAQLAVLGLSAPPPPPAGNCRVGPEFWPGAGQYASLPGDTCAEGQVITHNSRQVQKICYPYLGGGKVCKYGPLQ